MLREMTSAQLDEWIAFYRIEPWGLAVIDNLLASIKALLININTPKGEPKIKKLEGLLLWPDKPKRIDATLDEPKDDF
ncbi:MAG: hypothetical protein IJI07_01275 [Flexilinea sp.]|nr:hypothetical protein [Flexilinea sp.]